MSRTLTTSSAGITLTSGDNPVSVTSSGTVAGGISHYGIYGPGGSGNTWSIYNSGTIVSSRDAIKLGAFLGSNSVAPGIVTNQSGGVITGNHGVYIFGSGTVSNQNGASITGAGGAGIEFSGSAGVVINLGSVSGESSGVYEGAGGSVTNQSGGVITASSFAGVNIPDIMATVVNAGTIIGGNGAAQGLGASIVLPGSATNTAPIITSSSVSANNTGVGVYLLAGTLTNTGTIAGGVASNTITSGDGAYLAGNGTLTNTAGTIAGGQGGNGNYGGLGGSGIAMGSGGTLSNSAVIAGGAGGSASSSSGHGGTGGSGADLLLGGTVTNAGTGTIIGGAGGAGGYDNGDGGIGGNGLVLDQGGTVTNEGSIFGGIGGTGGTYVSGGIGGSGILMVKGGTLTNSGTVAGGAGGAGGYYGSGGSGGRGVALSGAGTLSNNAVILGGAGGASTNGDFGGSGVYLGIYDAQTGTLINNGTIIGGYGFTVGGYGVSAVGYGYITNTSAGVITGGDGGGGGKGRKDNAGLGAYLGGGGTLANAGTISGGAGLNVTAGSGGAGGRGVVMVEGGTIVNNALIAGGAGGTSGVNAYGYGGYGGYGVYFTGDTLTNNGTIAGGAGGYAGFGGNGGDGISQRGGVILNNGQIIAANGANSGYTDAGGNGGYGADVAGGSTLNNTGTIIGGNAGQSTDGYHGGFGGDGVAIYAEGTNVLTNSGLIAGGGAGSIAASTLATVGATAAAGPGVHMGSNQTFSNTGTVTGGTGLSVGAGSTLLINGAGAVYGGDGVYVGTSSTFSNASAGTIIGGTGVYLGAGSTLIVDGRVFGGHGVYSKSPVGLGGTVISGAGVDLAQGGVVVNAGTIGAAYADALQFGTAVGTLIVDPNAVFEGDVAANATVADVVHLASAFITGTLSGFGTSITNFASLVFDPGGEWTVSGNDSADGLGTMAITGFTVHDTIDLNGIAATSRTFANNTLVLSNTSASATLNVAGTFATPNFNIANDGSGGTFITLYDPPLYHIIPGSYSSSITLTNTAANPVLVSGTIDATTGTALYGQGGGSNTWTIDNSGTIHSSSKNPTDTGLRLGSSGTSVVTAVVTNEASAVISGAVYGIDIYGPASVTNLSGGVISGGQYAVDLNGAPSTIINAGTMAGAVKFGSPSPGDLLIVDPGAAFTGNIIGGTGGVELASGASAGVLSGFDGSTITNFSSLTFDPGAQWTISGNDSPTGLGTIAIDGFTNLDTIDLTGFIAVSGTFANNALVLTDAGNNTATLNIQGTFTTANFIVGLDGATTGTDVTLTDSPTCYAAGTRILTPRGEVAVERLREGDLVLTVSGRAQPIIWIGHRRVDFRRHPRRARVLPVRVTAHAFGEGRPKRDLLLSPDHAVFADDVLIPVRYLVNGRTIVQVERSAITYWHIELPRHDVLLAEGLPAETYLEAGARNAFANYDGPVQLHPDFTSPRADWALLWESQGYAPMVVAGETLARMRRAVARQADLLALGQRRRAA
jgi:fibronectin-binding autotransporter adhesin